MTMIERITDQSRRTQTLSLTIDGKRVEMDVKVGDIVIYAKYGGTEIKIDDEELIILRESDILAKKVK